LECSQFEIGQDEQGQFIRFMGRSSKTYKGGLKHLQLTNKDLKHYCPEGKLGLILNLQFQFKWSTLNLDTQKKIDGQKRGVFFIEF
jgi:hypothetical protein